MTQWYRMSDRADGDKPAIAISRDEAAHWNTPEQQFGIFLTVNSFNGARRKENLTKINAWAVDMDVGTKAEQQRKLLSSPLVPTMIVETKRGFQAWWAAKDGKAEHWNAIVLERLVPFFGSDRNARDLCRILRVPGYLHLKDPSDPFRIRAVWKHNVSYTERQLAQAFVWVPDKAALKAAHDDAKRAAESEHRERARQNAIAAGHVPSTALWDAIYELDCEEGLRRLSGHAAVSGEQYTFRRTSKGRLNIFVDGKGTPCFIDENRRIGSPSGGGPTLTAWLKWYGHSWRTVLDVMFEIYPHLREIDMAAKKRRAA